MPVSPDENLQKILDDAMPGQVIELTEGDFRAKILLRTPSITLRGSKAAKTRIIWDDYAKKTDEQGREYNTFRTWTMAVCADDVTMTDLSIINDALCPEHKGQEVALTVYGDRFFMERCTLTSTQDTLFLGPLPTDLIKRYDGFLPDYLRGDRICRQHFHDCLIEGTVDFIFGCGEAFFENCEIRSLRDARDIGYVAAPAHARSQDRGFLFQNCRMTAQSGVTPGSIFLARPWRDYGLSEFRDCSYGEHISTSGFDKWNNTDRDHTARFYEDPAVAGRVSWIKHRTL